MLFLALGSTVAGMLLWNRAIVRGGSTRISRLLYLEPVASVLGAMVFLGERATAAVLAGGLLVIAGVLVTGDSANGGKPDERDMVAGSASAARADGRRGRGDAGVRTRELPPWVRPGPRWCAPAAAAAPPRSGPNPYRFPPK
jgi:hypothetical protein